MINTMSNHELNDLVTETSIRSTLLNGLDRRGFTYCFVAGDVENSERRGADESVEKWIVI